MNEQREAEIVRIVQQAARDVGAKANVSYETDENGGFKIALSYDLGWRWRRTYNLIWIALTIAALVALTAAFYLCESVPLVTVFMAAYVGVSAVMLFFSAKIASFLSPIPTPDTVRLFARIDLHAAGFVVEDLEDGSSAIHDQ